MSWQHYCSVFSFTFRIKVPTYNRPHVVSSLECWAYDTAAGPRHKLPRKSQARPTSPAAPIVPLQELVDRLRPFAEQVGEEGTWEGILGAAARSGGMFDMNRVRGRQEAQQQSQLIRQACA